MGHDRSGHIPSPIFADVLHNQCTDSASGSFVVISMDVLDVDGSRGSPCFLSSAQTPSIRFQS